MKRVMFVVFSLLLTPSLFADAGAKLIPAGALVSCTSGDGRISSRTTAVGDPILCKVQFRRGDFMLPYGSYLGGQFADYKDPGHFVGKGWMELDFDRLYVGDQVLPISAKIADVPGYKIDAQGHILGRGHAVRDTVLWMIPVLWPIDLINLPRRGPRPTLKAETTLTLRVMDDIEVPVVPEPQRDPYGLYQRGPQSYAPQPPPPTQAPDEGQQQSYAPEQPAPGRASLRLQRWLMRRRCTQRLRPTTRRRWPMRRLIRASFLTLEFQIGGRGSWGVRIWSVRL